MNQVKMRLLGIVLALVMAMSFIPAMPVSANDQVWLAGKTEMVDTTFEKIPDTISITYNPIVSEDDTVTFPQISSGYKIVDAYFIEDSNRNVDVMTQEQLGILAAEKGMPVEDYLAYSSYFGTTIRTSFSAGYNYIFTGYIAKSDDTPFLKGEGTYVTVNGVDKTAGCVFEEGRLYINSYAGIVITCPSDAIEVNETNFPDDNFRRFIKDTIGNKDDKLTKKEIEEVKSLDLNVCEIKDLTGIEYFTALENLECALNELKSIDLSSNTNLKYLNVEGNLLEKISMVKNEKLSELWCSDNKLTELDLSNNTSLTRLSCDYNQLTSLDVSRNASLDSLYCKNNQLEVIYTAKEPDQFSYILFDEGVKVIVLTEADWNSKVEWKVNESDPSKTTATAVFECTKEGTTDYKVSVPMTVIPTSYVAATCEEEGSKSFEATLPAELSRTGNVISDAKTIKLPATGHSWGDWKVTRKATVASEGEETRICKNDPSHKETRKTDKLTPTPTAKPTAMPTGAAKPTATPTGAAKPTSAATVSIKLDKTAVNVTCGKTANLKATLKGATGKIAWTSSDNKIATVDANGKITTKQAGNVTITATAAGKSASCEVTVLYKDVTNTKDFWYAPTNYLTSKGVVKGYDKQTLFKPANDCTRAQMLTFMWRLQGEPAPKAKTCKFPDVKKTDYFFKPVIWAVEQGITTGYKDGTFKPQNVCTRAQTVTFLWRMAKTPKAGSSKNPFSDVKNSDYFYKAVLWASGKKIVAGYADGTFKPQGKCLRRQMVTFLYKYDKFVNGKG